MRPDEMLWNSPKQPPRQPKPGEHLWTLIKGGVEYRCEVRDRGSVGAEVQVMRGGELLFGKLWPSRALALNEATALAESYAQAEATRPAG